MFKRITVLTVVALVGVGLAVTPAARAQTTWYVDDDAPNDPGPGDPNVSDPDEDGSPEHPFDAIQEGIDAAHDGDEVVVCDGTYTGNGNKDLDFGGRLITVRSANGPENCIIDCEGSGRGFYFYSGETADAVVEGFTITNGYVTYGAGVRCSASSPSIANCSVSGNTAGNGGALYSGSNSSPTITNCTISGNSCGTHGGAVYCYSLSSPTLANCTITANTAPSGGALYCKSIANPTLTNCIITGNVADYQGGAVYCWSYCSPTLTNCTVSGNTAGNGGALYCGSNSSPTMTNCTITSNAVTSEGGGVCCRYDSSPTLTNCTISGNSATDGGAFHCYGNSSPTLTNCAISGNSCGSCGGGIYCYDSSPTVANCRFSGNSAASGAAMYNWNYSNSTVTNCTFSGNSASSYGGGIYCNYSGVTLSNCILWGDQPQEIYVASGAVGATYSDIQGGWNGTGNIDADPFFVDPDGPDDDPNTWEDNDYHPSSGSPCIDAADNEAVPADELDMDEDGNTDEPIPFDLDGKPRFVDDPDTDDTGNPDPDYPDLPIVDMGAYEFQVCPGDIDGDGDTDHADLGALLAAWGSQAGDPHWNPDADLDGNGQVGHGDLGIFLADWGCGT